MSNICSNTNLRSNDISSLIKEFNFLRRKICEALSGGGGGAVASVFGRTGVVAADAADYSAFYQGLDGDLSAIAALSGTEGILKKTATDTWELDTSFNQAFSTLSGTDFDFSVSTKKIITLTGDTDLTISNSISGVSSAILVVRQDGTGSRTLTIEGSAITINSSAGSYTLVGIIDAGGIFLYDTNVGSGGGNPLTDIVFTSLNAISEAAGVWTPSDATANWNHTGLATQTLPGDFRIQMKYDSSSSINAALGVSTTNALPASPYYDLACGVVIYTGGVVKKLNSDAGTTVGSPLTVGDYVALQRIGSTIKIQKSADGIVWTDMATMALSTSATLYIVCSMYNDGRLENPKGEGIV